MWATGAFAGPSLEEIAIRNAAAQGAASAYARLLTIDHVELQGVDHD